jgi:hypothetical protein
MPDRAAAATGAARAAAGSDTSGVRSRPPDEFAKSISLATVSANVALIAPETLLEALLTEPGSA